MFSSQKNNCTEFLYTKNNVSVYIKREDLLHKIISGNKFRKLKYNILEAKKNKQTTLLTFGGAYSNHISATAFAGKKLNFKTIGIIRGQELGVDLEKTLAQNATLKFAHDCSMQFKFISREAYRKKESTGFLTKLKNEFGDFYLIPEGGTNKLAIKGCQEILTKDDKKFDYICVAVGTGGTMSGLILSTNENQQTIGFSALKGNFLSSEIFNNVNTKVNWNLMTDYHFGGFAKINEKLVAFINHFKKEYKIALDPIYTGKLFFGIEDLISKNYFSKGTKILAIHTGGLQGIKAMNDKLNKKGMLQII